MGHGDGGNPHSNHFRGRGSRRKAGLLSGVAVALHRGIQGSRTYLSVVNGEVHRAATAICVDLIRWDEIRQIAYPLDSQAPIPDAGTEYDPRHLAFRCSTPGRISSWRGAQTEDQTYMSATTYRVRPLADLPVYCDPIYLFIASWSLMLGSLEIQVSELTYPDRSMGIVLFLISLLAMLAGVGAVRMAHY